MAERDAGAESELGVSQLWNGRGAVPAAIGGGLLVAMSIGVGFDITLASIAALLVFGATVGLGWARPGPSTDVGRVGLALAGLGTALTVLGWWLWMQGAFVGVTAFVWGFFVCLHGGVLLVGVETTRSGVLSRWSPLPAGVGAVFALAGLAWIAGGVPIWSYPIVAATGLGGLGWTALGYGLWSTAGDAVVPDPNGETNGETAGGGDPSDDASGDGGPGKSEPGQFSVSGRVTVAESEPVAEILVRAFDRDLRSEQRLGEARSDDDGYYEIRYAVEDFSRAEKDSADLVVRAYNDVGTPVAESDVVYNAAPAQMVDLDVESSDLLSPSEYERLRAELEPLLSDVALEDLTDEDVSFLAREIEIDDRSEAFPAGDESIALLSTAADLAAETPVRTDTFYGLGRFDHDLDDAALAATEPDTLRETLTRAVDEAVVPAALGEAIDEEIERLQVLDAERADRERATWEGREVTVRLLDEASEDPLEGYTVEVGAPGAEDTDAGTPDDPAEGTGDGPVEAIRAELDDGVQAVTDRGGSARLAVRLPPDDEADSRSREVRVLDHRGEIFHRETVTLGDGVIEIGVTPPTPAAPPSTPGDDSRGDEPTDPSVGGGTSVGDTGGQLHLLAPPETSSALADRGYASVSDIAAASPAAFVRSMGDVLSTEEIGRVRAQAEVQTAVLDSLATDDLTTQATMRSLADADAPSCEPSESAISPRAYLSALLTYVETYVTRTAPDGTETPLDGETVVQLFHQPVDELTQSAGAAEEPVRQVRLSVERLLGYLGEAALQPTDGDGSDGDASDDIQTAFETYRLEAYDALLDRWGTSRAELRTARHDEETRDAIARRIGVEPRRVAGDGSDPTLSLDSTAPRDAPDALSEHNLQRRFSLPALTEFDDGSVSIRDPLATVDPAALRTWRREHLQRTWTERDHPTDTFSRGDRPVVDPDVIGPDDFRWPDPAESVAFALWVKRREWVDGQLASLLAEQPDLSSMYGEMTTADALEYDGDTFNGPWVDGPTPDQFADLAEQLAADEADEAEAQVRTGLLLDVEAFTRLVEIDQRHEAAEEGDGESLSAEEWRELVSILVGAQTASLGEAWVEEEIAITDAEPGDLLDPRRFWLSLRNPSTGEWSAHLDAEHDAEDRPFVDPLHLDREDLPEPTAGEPALGLYDDRLDQLDDFRTTLETAYHDADSDAGENPFDAVLTTVYGGLFETGPFAADDWGDYLETVQTEFDDGDETAETVLEEELFLAREDLDVLVGLRHRSAPDATGTPPSDSQLAEAVDLLLSPMVQRSAHEDWLAEEADAGLTTYWRALKADLPPWRATGDDRRRWQDALRARSEPPTVDPDHLDSEDYLVGESSPATNLWTGRRTRLGDVAGGIDLADGIKEPLSEFVGIDGQALRDLADRAARGEDVTERLAQLDLSVAAVSQLRAALDRQDAGETLTDHERETVRAILTAVWKRRAFGTWNREERADGVILSPDLFTAPDDRPSPLAADDPRRWRVGPERRRDWRKTLKSRTEQLEAVDEQLREAVAAAEEEAMPGLRDALIELIDVPDRVDANERVEWASGRLLIDLEADGCRKTTRVDGAIESLQTLVVALDVDRVDGGLADLDLALSDEYFEARWEWLGSYAQWKAGMGVYMYPQNVLLPTLRRQQSPAFEELASSLTGDSQLTPAKAEAAAARYAEYFEAICTLEPAVACLAENPDRGDDSRDAQSGNEEPTHLAYAFASSWVNGKKQFYYRAFDPTTKRPVEAASLWGRISALDQKGNYSLAGASTYDGTIYLFAFRREDDTELGVVRYDVDADTWTGFETIELPEGRLSSDDVDVVQRAGTDEPPSLVVQLPDPESADEGSARSRSRSRARRGRDVPDDPRGPGGGDVGGGTGGGGAGGGGGVGGGPGGGGPDRDGPGGGVSIQSVEDTPGMNPWGQTVYYGAFDRDGNPPSADNFAEISLPRSVADSRAFPPLSAAVEHDGALYVVGEFLNLEAGSEGAGKFHRDCYKITLGSKRTVDWTRYRLESSLLDVLDTDKPPVFLNPETDGIYAPDMGWYAKIDVGNDLTVFETSTPTNGFGRDSGEVVVHCNNVVAELDLEETTDTLANAFVRRSASRSWLQAVRVRRRLGYLVPRGTMVMAPVVADVREQLDDDRWLFGVDSSEDVDEDALDALGHTSETWLDQTQTPHRRTNVPYVEEAFFHVPLLVARQLTRSGEYEAALEWFRTVYDYTRVAVEGAQVWHGLVQEANGSRLQRVAPGVDWMRDPLVPHALAQGRLYPYTRFTVFSVVRCLLEQADEEFTRDTSESVARARLTYELALDLLDGLTDALASVEDRPSSPGGDGALVDGATTIADADDRGGLLLAVETGATSTVSIREAMFRDSTVARAVWELGGAADASVDGEPSAPAADDGRMRPQRATDASRRYRPEAWAGFETLQLSMGFCVPANPLPEALRLHATSNLEKIRSCRNIAGLERDLPSRAEESDVASAVSLGDGRLPSTERTVQPTNYRYDTLLTRSKELVNLARQIEADFLQALERRDQEAYQLRRARQDVELARSGVRLQDLRLEEARDRVTLSRLEQDRSEIRLDHYSELLEQGLIGDEEMALGLLTAAAIMQTAAGALYGVQAAHDWLKAGFTLGLFGSPGSKAAQALSTFASASSTTADIYSTYASYARREERWEHQRRLARQDVRIGSQQIEVARDRVSIVAQERDIAELETDHATDIAQFHRTKFTNRELYQWMSDLLERVYRYFLQQATATAKLAETQLAFERQEQPPDIIGAGYWESPRSGQRFDLDGDGEDRRGLTGSARLLRDIYRLDQYEFTTDERLLEVEKTISLAQVDPVALQQFRETGVLRFNTPMELFDRDHPGHHLRLIKDVIPRVVALTPPTDGVKATLSTSGVSRVVVGDYVFRTRVIRRQPESIVLRASQRDEGAVALQPADGETLRPFENAGVETNWELEMSKAANSFDYDTIADVLLTIEYTALESSDYRRQVTTELDPRESVDRAFSFADEFADQWYDLHNPDQTAEPMTVRFDTDREMFPPNLSRLEIERVQLYFFGVDAELEAVDVSLTFAEEGAAGVAGGPARPVDGVVRTPGASAWNEIRGKQPMGEWTLSLPDRPGVRGLFKEDAIDNILFVATVSGELPEWPV